MTRLLIAASGTGGHLFPAIAVAESLPEGWQVRWLGVPDRLETQLVPESIPLTTVRAGGLQGRGLNKLIQLIRLIGAIGTVRRLIRRERIEVVFTTGGYIAAPAIVAARWCGVPAVLHEANAIPGRVTRLMGRFCRAVAVGLPVASDRIPGHRPLLTGMPVRTAFLESQPLPDWVPISDGPLLVVIGGSQGAVGLNRMVRAVVPELLEQGCRIVHLTGRNDPEVGQLQHPNLVELPFSDEIPGLLQHADLAVSRAGAGSLSELAICRTPSILVPFPQAADGHQEANAACAARTGGAVIVHQHAPEATALRGTILRLLGTDVELLQEMRTGMEKLAVQDADQRLVDLLSSLVD